MREDTENANILEAAPLHLVTDTTMLHGAIAILIGGVKESDTTSYEGQDIPAHFHKQEVKSLRSHVRTQGTTINGMDFITKGRVTPINEQSIKKK